MDPIQVVLATQAALNLYIQIKALQAKADAEGRPIDASDVLRLLDECDTQYVSTMAALGVKV